MFIIIDNDACFTPVTYPIDTPQGERLARIALAAAGLESAPVWTMRDDSCVAYRTAAVFTYDPDDEVTAVYTPSPDLLRAATR